MNSREDGVGNELEPEGLFAEAVAFELSAPALHVLPPADRPEVALAGRSNVGKSSLINALFNRRALARTSSEPGRTRDLNFFLLGEDRLRLVDMPGYGYAKAPKEEIARWSALVRDYLRGRPGLSRVMLLIDSRHGLKPVDLEVAELLDASAVVYQVVLTKSDKISAPALQAVRDACARALARRPAAHPQILAVSALSGAGLRALRAEISALARSEPVAKA